MPKIGETLIGNKYEQGFGGKGANQCVTAARLGASTVFVTSVRKNKPFFYYCRLQFIVLFTYNIILQLGSDSFGKEYLEKLKTENIDVTHAKLQDNIHSGIAQIIVTETGISNKSYNS